MTCSHGFTLVEVLVAGMVLSLALLGVAAMSLTAYGQLDRSGEETSAVALGQQRIEWLRNQDTGSAALTAGTSVESLAGDYEGFTRTTTIQDDVPRVGVKQVTVSTTTPSGMSTEVVALINTT